MMKNKLYLIFLLLSSLSYAQTGKIKISGKVIGVKNEPLPGVSVTSVDASAAITDFEGDYTIYVENAKASITFSYVGYTKKTEVVGNRNTIDVTLAEAKNELEEVVVVGYGTQRKKDVTGAISSVNTKELLTVPTIRYLKNQIHQTISK